MGQNWGQGTTWYWRRVRAQVLQRDHYECQLRYPSSCTHVATEVHHTNSIAARGLRRADAIDPEECVAVCGPCHKFVTERQRRAGQLRSESIRRKRGRLPVQPHPGERS